MPAPGTLMFGLLLFALLLAAVVSDIRTMRIPNMLNMLIAVCGLSFQIWYREGDVFTPITTALAVCLLFATVRYAHFRMSGIEGLGMGDVKMAGAGALWFPLILAPLFLFVSSVSALIYALVSNLLAPAENRWRKRLPFGPFLALGIATAFSVEIFYA